MNLKRFSNIPYGFKQVKSLWNNLSIQSIWEYICSFDDSLYISIAIEKCRNYWLYFEFITFLIWGNFIEIKSHPGSQYSTWSVKNRKLRE